MGNHQSQPQPSTDGFQAPPGTIDPQQLSALQPSPPQRNGIQPAVAQYPFSYTSTPLPASNGQYTSPQGHNLTSSAGPTQLRKPTTSEHNDVNVNLPRFDPKALLNPRASNGRPALSSPANGGSLTVEQGGHPANANAATAATEPGMSSMIERMHNVSNRDAAPPRKRKSEAHDEDDESSERKKTKSTFQGANSGGTLSAHMKAEREKIAAGMGPSLAQAPIDLTADDDDEVVFTGENLTEKTKYDNEEVCYGAITAKANISRLPAVSQAATSAIPKDFWPKTKLTIQHDQSQGSRLELLDSTGRTCGNIADLRVASTLSHMVDFRERTKIRMKVYLHSHKRTSSQKVHQHVSLSYLPVSVALYGPRKRVTWLGTHLSQKQLFLSDPMLVGVPCSMEVVNPHNIRTVYGSNALIGQRRPQGSQPVQSVTRTAEEIRGEASSMFDKLVKHEDLPEMEPTSRVISTPLMAHQKKALHFLTDHEKPHDNDNVDSPGFSLWKPQIDKRGRQTWYNVITGQQVPSKPEPVLGGILADMMGLGKTLSILSLIAETKPEARAFAATKPPAEQECNARATLIICPKSVMSNWIEQIEAHVKQGKLSSYVYHGSSRTDDVGYLASQSIVLTTYNTAAAEFAAKGRPLAAINWFRIVLDEAHQIRNQSTQVSKACCDLSAQRRWAVTGTPVQNGLGDLGALIKFLRIKPFDEGNAWAQYIIAPFRNANTDVIAHLRLLVDSITLRRLKDTIGLKGRKEEIIRLKFTDKNRKIYAPLAGGAGKQFALLSSGIKGTRLPGKAYAHVLKSIGRLRAFCAHGLDMFNDEDRMEISEGVNPENAIAIDLGDEPANGQFDFVTEKQAYETLHVLGDSDADRCEKCTRKIGEQTSGIDLADDDDEESSSDEEAGDDTIGYLNPCYHLICPECRDTYIAQSQAAVTGDQRHRCPCCEAYIRFGLYEYHRSTLRDFVEQRVAKIRAKRDNKGHAARDTSLYDGPSEKVEALLRDLEASAQEYVTPGEPPIRSVIFSGWTTYLDLIEIALEDHNIGYVRLDGTMSVKQRTAVLDRFKSDPDVTVILVSIKAGGQGLNLTAASNVYMMEPQYNPGVQLQAIDRVHRLGQKRDVHITHYIMEDSVEEGILKLQARKKDLADLSLERKMVSKVEEAKKRIEDLKDLFK
ncbi:hypothetical protein LTR36_007776 [Oleoguttula mirabilis]|uniref:Uncharacterized protein n=1 Tax=Oleoguttula mirabilis TaxID=1507867 RepID=A0AAV9J9H3_9PEZI|nr:hypothetical protein LTR36_007776 [Oleoguttula mirabilis]